MGEAENSVFDNYEFVRPGKAVFFDRFISGNFAKELLSEYNKFVDVTYKDNTYLNSPAVRGGFLTNFNLYSSVAFEKFLNENGLKGIKMEDIDRLRESPNFSSSSFNLGVVYRGVGYPKERQAEKIARELYARGYNVMAQFSDFQPIVMSLSDLEIDFDDSYQKGIGLKLSKDANPFYSAAFHKKNNGMYFSLMDENGPISRSEKFNGKNILSDGTDSGLAKIVFSHDSKLFSSSGKFTDCSTSTRVAVVEKQ